MPDAASALRNGAECVVRFLKGWSWLISLAIAVLAVGFAIVTYYYRPVQAQQKIAFHEGVTELAVKNAKKECGGAKGIVCEVAIETAKRELDRLEDVVSAETADLTPDQYRNVELDVLTYRSRLAVLRFDNTLKLHSSD